MLSNLKEQFRRMQEAKVTGRENADLPNGLKETEPKSANTTKALDELPEDWERHWDEENGLHFYWNATTNESRWEQPK